MNRNESITSVLRQAGCRGLLMFPFSYKILFKIDKFVFKIASAYNLTNPNNSTAFANADAVGGNTTTDLEI